MQAIIFDIDGTLLCSNEDDDRLYKWAVQSILGSVQFRNDLHDYDHVSDGGILSQIFSDNRLTLDEATILQIKNAFFAGVQNHIDEHGPFPEIPGALDFLQRIVDSPDHVYAIATGGWRTSAQIKLHESGFSLEQVPLATSDDAVDRTDIMLHALRSLGAEFETVTYYGDGPWDRAASEQLGWSFVGVGKELGGIETFHGQSLSADGE